MNTGADSTRRDRDRGAAIFRRVVRATRWLWLNELKEMERSCTAVGARVGSLSGFRAAPVT